jgi:hypothetical protein
MPAGGMVQEVPFDDQPPVPAAEAGAWAIPSSDRAAAVARLPAVSSRSGRTRPRVLLHHLDDRSEALRQWPHASVTSSGPGLPFPGPAAR